MKLKQLLSLRDKFGQPKFETISDVLNNNPRFREAAERIVKREIAKRVNQMLYGTGGGSGGGH